MSCDARGPGLDISGIDHGAGIGHCSLAVPSRQQPWICELETWKKKVNIAAVLKAMRGFFVERGRYDVTLSMITAQNYRGTSLIRKRHPQDPAVGLCLQPCSGPRAEIPLYLYSVHPFKP